MKRAYSIVSIAAGLLVFASPLTSFAATYPLPIQTSVITAPYKETGLLSDVWVRLLVDGGPLLYTTEGYQSSHNITSATFGSPSINPYAMQAKSNTGMAWEVNDPFLPDITACQMDIRSQDNSNSYFKTIDTGTSSGSQTFDTTQLIPGNYTFSFDCSLKDGNTIADTVFAYIVPPAASAQPTSQSILTNTGSCDSGYCAKLAVNGNLGYINTESRGGLIISAQDPYAFAIGQSYDVRVTVTYPSGILGTGLFIPGFGPPYIKDCSFAVNKLGGSQVYQIGITQTPIVNQGVNFDTNTLSPGNFNFSLSCNLSNNKQIQDYMIIYVTPTVPVSSQPQAAAILSATLTANPATVVQPGVNQTGTTTLTATVGGTATGSVAYTFYCDATGSPSPVSSSNTKTCGYNSPGNYTAKVVVNRAGLSTTATTRITVQAPGPSVTLQASPSSIRPGGTSTLSWSSSNANSCTATGPWPGGEGAKNISGQAPVSPSQSTTYYLSCSGPGGTAATSTTVMIQGAPTLDIKIK